MDRRRLSERSIPTGCPASIERSVVERIQPGTHELFIGKAEVVHVDEEYLGANGNILRDRMDLMSSYGRNS
ncbi:MAG: hypothetical protein IJ769_00325 [Clostridia bacterium]|nr:hypothetical protein [Clostridia bacterium]